MLCGAQPWPQGLGCLWGAAPVSTPASFPRAVSYGGDAAESSTDPQAPFGSRERPCASLLRLRGSLASPLPPVVTASLPSTLPSPPWLQSPGLKPPIPQGGPESTPGLFLVGVWSPQPSPVLSKEGSVLPGLRPQRLARQVAHTSVCLCVSVCMSPSLPRAHHAPSIFCLVSASF